MGKYLDRKAEAEQTMKDIVDGMTERFLAKWEDAERYSEAEKRNVRANLLEAYASDIDAPHRGAIAKEEKLFEELKQDVEKVLTTPPTVEQLRFLDTLALKGGLTQEDIQVAAIAVKDNALALSALQDIADKHGLGEFAALEAGNARIPSLKALKSDLDAFKESRANSIRRYGQVDGSGQLDEWFPLVFDPRSSHRAFDLAEAIIEQYGA